MSIYVLQPWITDELVVKIFEHFCNCEIKKIFGCGPQNQNGQQDGYFKCLFDFFGPPGKTLEDTLDDAFYKGKSYINVMDNLIDTELSEDVERILETCNNEGRDVGSLEDIIEIETSVKRAVKDYYRKNPDAMREALKFM